MATPPTPATTITRTVSRSHVFGRLSLPTTRGSINIPSATMGRPRPDCMFFSSMAVPGTRITSPTFVAELPANSDVGLNDAVNPDCNPDAENVTAAGNVVPPDGLSGNVKVAVPPGATVCDEPLPPTVRVKS